MQIIISYCDFYINISEWNLVCSIDLKRKKTILEGFIWKKWVISKRRIYSLWYSVALKLTVNIQFHFNCDNLCQAWFQIYNFHYAPFDSYVCMCVLSVDQRLIAAGLGTPLLLLALVSSSTTKHGAEARVCLHEAKCHDETQPGWECHHHPPPVTLLIYRW